MKRIQSSFFVKNKIEHLNRHNFTEIHYQKPYCLHIMSKIFKMPLTKTVTVRVNDALITETVHYVAQ